MKKIVIIKGGNWEALFKEKDEDDSWLKILKNIIEDKGRTEVAIANTFQEILTRVKYGEKIDTLVFISRDTLDRLRQAKEKYPAFKKIEVIFISKDWLPSSK